ncbi:MAG: tetratricopeptide repeat protein [Hyphomicrobiales bacterium]
MREIPWQDIPRDKVMAALRRVLLSAEFKSAPQLAAFLTFSVSRTLEGRGALLKAYTVATEVLGRHADFDPQTDPIVRVEATRLRRALDRYYLAEGRDDPVRITMPRGGYSIIIHGRDEDPEERPPYVPDTAQKRLIVRAQVYWAQARNAVALLAAMGFLISTALLFLDARPSATDNNADTRPRFGALIAGTISGLPNAEGLDLADMLVEAAVHFDGIIAFSGMVPRPPDDLYVVEGTSFKDNAKFKIDLRLRHAATGRVIWTTHLHLKAEPNAMRLAAHRLAARIAGRNGPIRSDAMPAKIDAVSGRTALRSCLAVTDAAIRSAAAPLQSAARRCLDEALVDRSESAVLLASSALLRISVTPDETEKSEAEARMAVTLNPANADAANFLANLALNRGDPKALEWGDKAISANPFDPALLRDDARRREILGQNDKAALLVAQATMLEAGPDED